jgi:hypothetical protein
VPNPPKQPKKEEKTKRRMGSRITNTNANKRARDGAWNRPSSRNEAEEETGVEV